MDGLGFRVLGGRSNFFWTIVCRWALGEGPHVFFAIIVVWALGRGSFGFWMIVSLWALGGGGAFWGIEPSGQLDT